MFKYLGHRFIVIVTIQVLLSLSMTITKQTLYNYLSKMQGKAQCFDSVSCYTVGIMVLETIIMVA